MPQSGQKQTQLEASRAQSDLRDRLATLLARGYADLRVAGYYQFREELAGHMPARQARLGGGKKKPPTLA